MTHDPLCDWLQEICTPETCDGPRLGDPCKHEWCQCYLIAKVRADERGGGAAEGMKAKPPLFSTTTPPPPLMPPEKFERG